MVYNCDNYYLYTSNDYGHTWIQRSPYGIWRGLGMSGDGRIILSSDSYNAVLWLSLDYGQTRVHSNR